MGRKKVLAYLVGGLALIGLAIAFAPFVLSLNPSKRVDASLPRIKVSSLEPGKSMLVNHPQLPGSYSKTFWSILFVRKHDGELKAWKVLTKDSAVLMPDLHWWRPFVPCKHFGPTEKDGRIDETAPIQCHDEPITEWWSKVWRWDIDGKNLSGQADDMESAKGVVEDGYFVVGKRG